MPANFFRTEEQVINFLPDDVVKLKSGPLQILFKQTSTGKYWAVYKKANGFEVNSASNLGWIDICS